MESQKRMPRYDVRNDGIGPYAIFYCDKCYREYRSQPNVGQTIASDISRDAARGFLRKIPLFGGAIADNVVGEDPRYVHHLSPQEVEAAWNQVKDNFRECPTCRLIVCLSDFDSQSGYCNDDTPRKAEIAQAQTEQTVGVLKGIANAFGIGEVVQDAVESAKAGAARCPQDGTLAAPGTKFCPKCGSAMIQPAADPCPSCGADAKGAKFCPECGTKIERATQAPSVCSNCGAKVEGVKFCPECGTKVG